jgi:O-antigen ligase
VCGGLALGLLVADLLLTFSRGALWATLAAVAIVTAAYVRLKLRGEAQAAPVAVPAALAACVALVVAPVALAAIGSTGWAHEFWTPTSRDASDSAVRRAQLWTCAMQVFERHPIVGVGAANFADAKQECPASLAGSEHFNANEWYLETAADLGVVGLALLVAFLCIVLAKGRSRAVWHAPVALGAYAVLIAFIMHGFIDDVADYPKAALSFFVLMGLLESRMIPPM